MQNILNIQSLFICWSLFSFYICLNIDIQGSVCFSWNHNNTIQIIAHLTYNSQFYNCNISTTCKWSWTYSIYIIFLYIKEKPFHHKSCTYRSKKVSVLIKKLKNSVNIMITSHIQQKNDEHLIAVFQLTLKKIKLSKTGTCIYIASIYFFFHPL